LAEIIHSYCSTCLIIDGAPFKVCCDGHISPASYLSICTQAGKPGCKDCILQDKPVIKIDTKIGKAIIAAGGSWSKREIVKINNKTLGHLIEDHHRQTIVFDVVPKLPTLLSSYGFVDVLGGGEEFHYYIDLNGTSYRVPVKKTGNRWIIRSVFAVFARDVNHVLTKPKGTLVHP
jgi:hypothetical protein